VRRGAPAAAPKRRNTYLMAATTAVLAATVWAGVSGMVPASIREAVQPYLAFSPAQLLYGGFVAGTPSWGRHIAPQCMRR